MGAGYCKVIIIDKDQLYLYIVFQFFFFFGYLNIVLKFSKISSLKQYAYKQYTHTKYMCVIVWSRQCLLLTLL